MGFLLIDFSLEQQFSNWVLQTRVSTAFLQGAKSRSRRHDADVPTCSSANSALLIFVLHIGVLSKIVLQKKKKKSCNVLIYIYTTNLEVRGPVSNPLILSQRTKNEWNSPGTIYLWLILFLFMDLWFILIALLRSEGEG